MIEVGFMLITLALCVWVTGRIAALRVRDLENQAKVLEKLYGLCAALIDDDRVSYDLSRFVRFLAANAVRRSMAWKFVCGLAFNRAGAHAHQEVNSLLKEIERLPPDAKTKFQQAVVFQLLCLTFNHIVLGRLIRRMVLWALTPNGDSAPKIIETMGWCDNDRHLRAA